VAPYASSNLWVLGAILSNPKSYVKLARSNFHEEGSVRRYLAQRELLIGLVIAILLQWGLVALCYFNVIHDPYHETDTWHFHQGGDQDYYFALARSLAEGHPISSFYTLGYPLMLTPVIAVLHPGSANALITPIAIFNSLILFPVSQIIFIMVAMRIVQRWEFAVSAVLLWTLLPLGYVVGLGIAHNSDLGAGSASPVVAIAQRPSSGFPDNLELLVILEGYRHT
jgi:hypothetical protein